MPKRNEDSNEKLRKQIEATNKRLRDTAKRREAKAQVLAAKGKIGQAASIAARAKTLRQQADDNQKKS